MIDSGFAHSPMWFVINCPPGDTRCATDIEFYYDGRSFIGIMFTCMRLDLNISPRSIKIENNTEYGYL